MRNEDKRKSKTGGAASGIKKISKRGVKAVMVWNDDRQVPELKIKEDIPYLQFKSLSETGIVKHLFSTRGGGVSEGVCSSMNLSFSRGDDRENVEENFRRIAKVLGCTPDDMVSTDQTHTANVRLVGREDRGHGITRNKTFFDTDGLITDEPGIVLAAFFADCVPLFFVDPIKKAIGLSHSGWKGTVQGIGEVTVRKMNEYFGSKPEDIVAAIGPSICAGCYEISEDVAGQFMGDFWEKYHNDSFQKITFKPEERSFSLLQQCENHKYRLNLWAANRCVLEKAGILPEHIEVTDLCTCCNGDELFSHRASHGKRGNLGAFLGLV